MKVAPSGRVPPQLLFEVSWEVAHKVGGIHTVLTGKAPLLHQQRGPSYLCIGPYLPQRTDSWDESPTLFSEWRTYFPRKYGYAIHAGYWHIKEARIPTLLVDFYPLISQKNHIFTELWEQYRVDSLFGEWDYIEPAIFGYAAGQAVASFLDFYYGEETEGVAHFHEWLAGAGVLYLRRYAPRVATLFTTHATVAGRAAGGQLFPLEELPGWLRSRGLTAKHSLERAAWQNADATTTVSEMAAREAAHYLGRPADVLTPNGWDPPQNLPIQAARAWLRQLHEAWGPEEEPFWLLHAGRPELDNKGTLLLLEALRLYRQHPFRGKRLQVILALPAEAGAPLPLDSTPLWISHALPDSDPLLQLLRSLDLRPEEPLRIAYLPVYLEGRDGHLNVPYYALLAAMDASAFPSRYEPWGYTPQESLGLGVPTLASVRSGFGAWMQAHAAPLPEALTLIDPLEPTAAGFIHRWLHRLLGYTPAERATLPQQALRLGEKTRWHHFLPFYGQAYELARLKAHNRLWHRQPLPPSETPKPFVWHRAFFSPNLPEALRPLRTLAYNLWWSWTPEVQQLFAAIDPEGWEAHENPVWLLNRLSAQTLQRLLSDENYLQRLGQTFQRFQAYMAQPLRSDGPRVAYICMEYGLTKCLPFYSGGLGVLAGDYLKEASDQGYPLTGIGLLYRKGYFVQRISPEGEQIAEWVPLRFTDLPLEPVHQPDGRWLRLHLEIGELSVYLKVWCIHVGRIPLYLLDADLPENPPEVRLLTERLYPGEPELRLKQELVLGFGAQALVEALALPVDIFHYNEGHPAFHIVAHLTKLCQAGYSLSDAIEEVRSRTLFTTHTPVPAGHDAFTPELMRPYLGAIVTQKLRVPWETFLQWGEMPTDPGKFSLTAFALRFSARANAVSQLHKRVSQKMFAPLYPGYLPAEVPIEGVTNGVHVATWQAPEWSRAKRLWETHQVLKKKLLLYLRRRLGGQPWPVAYLRALQEFLASTDEDTLLLGFARRVTAYKRHTLLFAYEGLGELLQKAPVRILIAGKAHPNDEAGKAAVRTLWQKSLEAPYRGRVLFLAEYEMQLARLLVQGVDVWLNLPVFGQEASGTSGMKACLNGVLHLSVPDGWWAEVPPEAAGGWALPLCQSDDPALRDTWEAVQLTYLLQEEVLPTYLQRDAEGLPVEWIARMLKAQTFVQAHFSLTRMLTEYSEKLYLPLWQRYQRLSADVRTKRQALLDKIAQNWPSLALKEAKLPHFAERSYAAGQPFTVEIELIAEDLPPEALRVELVWESATEKVHCFPLAPVGNYRYAAEVILPEPGVYHYALRAYAWDPYTGERLWSWVKLW